MTIPPPYSTKKSKDILKLPVQQSEQPPIDPLAGRALYSADGSKIFDETGLPTGNFQSGSLSDLSSRTTTSTTFVDVDETEINFNLFRDANVLIMATVQARIYDAGSDTTVWEANIPLNIDGANDGAFMNFIDQLMSVTFSGDYSTRIFTMSTQRIKALTHGDHTIKLRMKTSGHTLQVLQTDISYVVLGK